MLLWLFFVPHSSLKGVIGQVARLERFRLDTTFLVPPVAVAFRCVGCVGATSCLASLRFVLARRCRTCTHRFRRYSSLQQHKCGTHEWRARRGGLRVFCCCSRPPRMHSCQGCLAGRRPTRGRFTRRRNSSSAPSANEPRNSSGRRPWTSARTRRRDAGVDFAGRRRSDGDRSTPPWLMTRMTGRRDVVAPDAYHAGTPRECRSATRERGPKRGSTSRGSRRRRGFRRG